jgi:excinuclease UvrABC helicase subunit UvrB
VHGISSLEGSLPDDLNLEMARVEKAMLAAARDLQFEEAAVLRDYLQTLHRQGLNADLDGLTSDPAPVN